MSIMRMKKNLLGFALADTWSCQTLFGCNSSLAMKRTSCRIVAANFVARRCGIVLPDRVEVLNFDMKQTIEVDALQKYFHPTLTLNDAASLFIAKEEKLVLITDDGAIRRCANEMQIETMGTEAFASQVAQVEADGAPPSSLANDRRELIKNKETNEHNQNIHQNLKSSYYE